MIVGLESEDPWLANGVGCPTTRPRAVFPIVEQAGSWEVLGNSSAVTVLFENSHDTWESVIM